MLNIISAACGRLAEPPLYKVFLVGREDLFLWTLKDYFSFERFKEKKKKSIKKMEV